jgi:MFS family permease
LPAVPSLASPARTVMALAFAETIIWAGVFYIFPALLAHWEADLGWSKTTLSGAFTASLITSALCAPIAGRLIDAGYGRLLLTGGAACAGVLIGLVSLVQVSWQFYALWIALGACMACALYEPCFAFLTRTRGGDARRAITRITLIAGLAGTVSFPTANLLAELYGWRSATTAFALAILLIALPLFRYGTRPVAANEPASSAPSGSSNDEGLRAAMRRPTFWLLAVAFSMIALTHGILITHLLPMLDERGVSTSVAVLVASGIGPMQVAGRVAMMAMERHVSMNTVCAVSFVFMLAAATALIGAGAIPLLLVAFVVLQGSGYGVTSITRPVVTANLLGRTGFGAISGALALPFMGATAISPTLAAAIWTVGGYDLVRLAVLGLVGVGAASFVLAILSAQRR